MLVMIVEDHPLVRQALTRELQTIQPGMAILGEESLCGAIATLRSDAAPDLLVLDLNLPDARGMSAIHEVSSIYPVDRVVAFSGEEDQELVRCVHSHGARGDRKSVV